MTVHETTRSSSTPSKMKCYISRGYPFNKFKFNNNNTNIYIYGEFRLSGTLFCHWDNWGKVSQSTLFTLYKLCVCVYLYISSSNKSYFNCKIHHCKTCISKKMYYSKENVSKIQRMKNKQTQNKHMLNSKYYNNILYYHIKVLCDLNMIY